MFVKQKDGVYSFGSKTVTMKVENKILMVRTGGGYLTIEQFVHQYLNLELEKQDRIQQLGMKREEKLIQQDIEIKEAKMKKIEDVQYKKMRASQGSFTSNGDVRGSTNFDGRGSRNRDRSADI